MNYSSPDWRKYVREHLPPLGLSAEREVEIVEELAAHLETAYEKALSSGVSEAEARERALAQIADWRLMESELSRAEQTVSDRAVKRSRMLEDKLLEQKSRSIVSAILGSIVQDLRLGLRMLLKHPVFTLVAIITLALGIGANTTIFSVVNAVLLRPLPYPQPEQLVRVWETDAKRMVNEESATPPNFIDWSRQQSVFEYLAAYTEQNFNLSGMAEPERLEGYRVSAALFPLLGVEASLGRTFLPEEDQYGAERVVLLSDGLWQRRFGSDPAIIGKGVNLDDQIYTVVGVMPPRFYFQNREKELWVPLAFTQREQANRWGHYLQIVGRLKPDVRLEQAQAEMSTIARRLEEQYPNSNQGAGVNLIPLHESLVGEVRITLLILLGAVGCVLLIACANVASMLLARGVVREREVAIRAALGAGRLRIAQQLLTESLLLALLGGGLGLLLGIFGKNLLVFLDPGHIDRLTETSIDRVVLLFTFGISIFTGIIFGLAPILQLSSSTQNESLKEGGRGLAGASSHRFRHLLVIAEVSLTVVLLVGAGLLINSFLRLQGTDPGFNAKNLLTMRVDLPQTKYRELHQRTNFFQQAREQIQAVPGVQAAGSINFLPLAFQGGTMGIAIEGKPAPQSGASQGAVYRVVSPDYFHTMGIPLRGGRDFSAQDTPEMPGVVIINEALARRYWPDEDALGKRLSLSAPGSNNSWLMVVGVVGDVRQFELRTAPVPEMFVPLSQPHPAWAAPRVLVVRTSSDPLSLAASVREAVWAIDRDLPVSNIESMEQVISTSVAQPRFYSVLIGWLGAVALLLAAVGIYGIISFTVSQRTHEIGVRMALGAQRRDVVKLVVGQGLLLTLIGAGVGLGASLGLTRFLSSLLFGVSPTDPMTFVGVSVLLIAVALLACYLPARRATKVDPLVALRYE